MSYEFALSHQLIKKMMRANPKPVTETSMKNPTSIVSQNDPVLQEIIEHIDEPKIASSEDVFYDLVTCIVDQQIHYKAKGNLNQKTD